MDLSLDLGDGHQRELLDVTVELLVVQRQTNPGDQLTELVELGRLERDGITRLNVHRVPILADGAPRGPVGCENGANYSTTRPSSPSSGGGTLGSSSRSTSTSTEATATSRTHLWSAGTTYHGDHFVVVSVIASS